MLKINSTSGLADMHLSHFHRNNIWLYLPGFYLGGKFDEDRRKIVILQHSTCFVWQTLTHSLT